MSDCQTVLVEKLEQGIATVTLNRPDALNAFSWESITALRETLAELKQDAAVRVIILSGAGRGFCAGLDLKTVNETRCDGRFQAMESMRLQEFFAGVTAQLRSMPQPVIAAIKGPAVGLGLGLALAADIRVLGHSAKLLVGAIKIGLSAGESGISYHLPRLVGAGRAFEIMLTGRTVDADEAMQIGLGSRLVNDADVAATALDIARQVAANSPYAVKHTKQVMWKNLDASSLDAALELENHIQAVAMVTDDFSEAIDAFGEQRPPRFTGS